MRRLALLAVPVALLLIGAPAAPAKEGTLFDPPLGALTPGRAADVGIAILPRYDSRGLEKEPAPRPGSSGVVTLRSDETGEVLRFPTRALPSQPSMGFLARVRITVPVRATRQQWAVTVRIGGRRYVDVMHGKLDVIAVRRSPAASVGGHGGGQSGWLLGLGALAIAAGGGWLVVRRQRGGGDDAHIASPGPIG